MRMRSSIAAIVVVAAAAACNAITGVDSLTFDRAAGGAGGSGGAAGSGGNPFAAGAAGAKKCEPKTVLFADPCWTCGKQKCCKEIGDCEGDSACTGCFETSTCGNPPPPSVYNLYYCLSQSCADECSFGQGGAAGTGGAPPAGGSSADCASMPSQQCEQCCATQHPIGANEYVKDWRSCTCANQNGACALACPTACVTFKPDGTDCTSCLVSCVGGPCSGSKACTEFYDCAIGCPQ